MRFHYVYDFNRDDKGTGHVTILNPTNIQFTIIVKAEAPEYKAEYDNVNYSNPAPVLELLHHKIVDGLDYQRQGDTIVTWCEASTGLDLALSFQDTVGCGKNI